MRYSSSPPLRGATRAKTYNARRARLHDRAQRGRAAQQAARGPTQVLKRRRRGCRRGVQHIARDNEGAGHDDLRPRGLPGFRRDCGVEEPVDCIEHRLQGLSVYFLFMA